jgi:hypothetical protein
MVAVQLKRGGVGEDVDGCRWIVFVVVVVVVVVVNRFIDMPNAVQLSGCLEK